MATGPSQAQMIAGLKERGIDLEAFSVMVNSTNETLRPIVPIPPLSAAARFMPNSAAAKRRPNAQRIEILQRNIDGLDDLCAENRQDTTTCFIRSNVLKAKAGRQLVAKEYSEARGTYILAASEMVAAPLPGSGDVRSDIYKGLGRWEAVDLMGCINGVVECSRQLRDYDAALLWAEEADVLDKNLEIASTLHSAFEWARMEMALPDYYFERITSLCLASDVFLSVGNTGSAVHRRWVADEMFAFLPEHLKTPQLGKLTPLLGSDIMRLRHPDPNAAPALMIEQPNLQLYGSWQKMSIRKAGTLSSRMRSAIFALDGKLYVLGGEKFTEGPWYRDFWMLDLEKLDGWQQLPEFPLPKTITDNVVGFQMVPHRDGRAFVFTGMPVIPVFDTKRRKWSMMMTTFIPDAQTPEWPYSSSMRLIEYTAQCIGDRLYVFGGLHSGSIIGTDLLMELHIPSRKWRRLSGTVLPIPSVSGPGPREQCHSWVGKDKSRIFFMFGEADRQAAMIHKQVNAGFYSYGYGDLWSWDIKAETWTRERLHGNVPSPRAEMSCTYNEALDKVIVFGGYSPTVPTWFDDIQDTVTYTYYADTFIGDMAQPSSPSARSPIAWKQVLTRGFPTYRAQATLVTDAKTGKVFLFGGYKNTTYVRSKTAAPSSSRSFMDLWQLRLDLRGGFFEGVDLEEEARTAKVGPWQRCFTCGSTGPWKRCGGTCNGRAFFCDSDCLKEGWKEHKEKHDCRKAQ